MIFENFFSGLGWTGGFSPNRVVQILRNRVFFLAKQYFSKNQDFFKKGFFDICGFFFIFVPKVSMFSMDKKNLYIYLFIFIFF